MLNHYSNFRTGHDGLGIGSHGPCAQGTNSGFIGSYSTICVMYNRKAICLDVCMIHVRVLVRLGVRQESTRPTLLKFLF